MTDRRSITLPLCVLGAGAVHGLCVAAMLPMLVTLPGPASNAPQAIDVEVIRAAPHVAQKQSADPATTSALPELSDASAEPSSAPSEPPAAGLHPSEVAPQSAPEDAAAAARTDPSQVEVAPDDMPQQVATPAAPAPSGVDALKPKPSGIDALTPEPLVPTLVTAPALQPPAPVEVKTVMFEADDDITSSIVPVAADSSTERLGEAAVEPSAPTPVSETPPAPEPQAETARADPKEETQPQASPNGESAEAETPEASAPMSVPATAKKIAPKATPKAKSQAGLETKSQAKAPAKAEPAAKKRPSVAAKRPTQPRRVLRQPQTPINQGIMSLFSLKPPMGIAPQARRPLVRQ